MGDGVEVYGGYFASALMARKCTHFYVRKREVTPGVIQEAWSEVKAARTVRMRTSRARATGSKPVVLAYTSFPTATGTHWPLAEPIYHGARMAPVSVRLGRMLWV